MGATWILGQDNQGNKRLDLKMTCDNVMCQNPAIDAKTLQWRWSEDKNGKIQASMLLCPECALKHPELNKTQLTAVLMVRGFSDYVRAV